ncbi:hypothetical protein CEP82_000905 [Mobiluncus mulieris]|nr:hypothetical protein CEP82_000905 [Mobiluncus mulieris]
MTYKRFARIIAWINPHVTGLSRYQAFSISSLCVHDQKGIPAKQLDNRMAPHEKCDARAETRAPHLLAFSETKPQTENQYSRPRNP